MPFKLLSQHSLVTLLTITTVLAACTGHKNQSSQTIAPTQSGSIINGKPVALTESFWKHTVSVGPADEPFCTGVIISNDTVLTAGHCAEDLDGTYVHFGLDFAAKTAVRLSITKVTPHPDYCSQCGMSGTMLFNYADITVVKFSGKMPEGFAPVEFAKKSDLTVGMPITLAGFGLNEKHKYETIMKFTSAPLKLVGNSEFSTDETKAGSCSGDSGGPAFIEVNGKYLLAGITSRGDAACRQIGIYTIPVVYNDWILEEATQPQQN